MNNNKIDRLINQANFKKFNSYQQAPTKKEDLTTKNNSPEITTKYAFGYITSLEYEVLQAMLRNGL